MRYRYFRWLSLDIVLGAIIFLNFLARFYQVNITYHAHFSLAIAIWLIYTTDHLIDARNSLELDDRRKFHRRHEHTLIFVSGLLAVVGLVNIYFLPLAIIKSGVILTAVCVVYLMMVYFFRKLWFKEVLIAAGYACGIFLAPFSLNDSISVLDIYLLFQLACLALLNLLIFSYYDREKDKRSGFGSIVLLLESQAGRVIYFLSLLVLGSCMYFLFFFPGKYEVIQAVYLIMTLLFFILIRFHLYFGKNERFRVFGDAIFFVPIFFMSL